MTPNAMLSCQHVLIDGRSAGEVKMDCNEFNACWDMKVYCPPYNILDGTKQCIISGMLCILALGVKLTDIHLKKEKMVHRIHRFMH